MGALLAGEGMTVAVTATPLPWREGLRHPGLRSENTRSCSQVRLCSGVLSAQSVQLGAGLGRLALRPGCVPGCVGAQVEL